MHAKMRSLIPSKATMLMIGSLVLAAATGVIVSTAVASGTSSTTPTRTVTVDLTNGAQGPPGPPGQQGPPGPPGKAGDFTCADNYEPGVLVINHPGGHVRIFTCLETPETTTG